MAGRNEQLFAQCCHYYIRTGWSEGDNKRVDDKKKVLMSFHAVSDIAAIPEQKNIQYQELP